MIASNRPVFSPLSGAPATADSSGKYSAEEAAAFYCPRRKDPARHGRLRQHLEAIWPAGGCQIYHSAEDDFSFAVPFVGGTEEFYNLIHAYKRDPAWRWDYDFALASLDRKREAAKILDIGAGDGHFLASLPATWERYAVEQSEHTRQVLAKKKIIVANSLEELSRQMPGSFYAITLFQVLEHVGDPAPLLSLCRRLIAPGGRVIVSVPERTRNLALRALVGYKDVPPAHVSWWSEKSLRLALTEADFSPLQYRFSPNSWAEFQSALYYRLVARAMDDRSLAARCYGLRPRPVRNLALLMWLAASSVRCIPRILAMRRGRTIAVAAQAGESSSP